MTKKEEIITLGELRTYSRTIEVVESADVIGVGTEEDPQRTLLRIWAKDGSRLIGMFDPLRDHQERQKQLAAQKPAEV